MGRAPKRVNSMRIRVAIGDNAPAAANAIPGWYPKVEK
jgi:hypothetical protein